MHEAGRKAYRLNLRGRMCNSAGLTDTEQSSDSVLCVITMQEVKSSINPHCGAPVADTLLPDEIRRPTSDFGLTWTSVSGAGGISGKVQGAALNGSGALRHLESTVESGVVNREDRARQICLRV
jgi:hypothetical protein